MKNVFEIRTDLALEVNEQVNREKGRLKGVIINEMKDNKTGIKVTVLEITGKEGVKALHRPEGKYITIEAGKLGTTNDETRRRAAVILQKNLEDLVPGYTRKKKKPFFWGGGFENVVVTADPRGRVVKKNIKITRHYAKEAGIQVAVAGLAPGVMAQTGMETAELVRGVVRQLKPDVLIAIDSLAARDSSRLNTTIQLSSQGIHPGSGVGNHRIGITEDVVGVPVLAIGVPTVVDAPTIVNDTMENFLKAIAQSKELKSVSRIFSEYSPREKYELIREVISPEMVNMYVTPKDIDANIKAIGHILAKAIDMACEDLQMIGI